MKIAIASGKGGAGKTLVATNMARIAARHGECVSYLDCDVEEPNGDIFLKPNIIISEPVTTTVPRVNHDACNLCGKCDEICQYGGIVCIGKQVLIHPELCHSCGGCSLACPLGAIDEVEREIGRMEIGEAGSLWFVQGILNIGEARSAPLIKAVRQKAPEADLVLIDAPPGTSCPVMESIRGCDYVVLVTEATPFGLNDFKLAVETVRALALPFGAIINRCDLGEEGVRQYCRDEGIQILAALPEDREIGDACSNGRLICEINLSYEKVFRKALESVMQKVTRSEGIGCH